MFSSFTTLLHADAPALNRRRANQLEIGRALLDQWWVEVTFGRIGRAGRTLRFRAKDEGEAQNVAACLARRGSAARRIGVGYEEQLTFDPQGWDAGFKTRTSTRPPVFKAATPLPCPPGSTDAPPTSVAAALPLTGDSPI